MENLHFESSFVRVEVSLWVQVQKQLSLQSLEYILEWAFDPFPYKPSLIKKNILDMNLNQILLSRFSNVNNKNNFYA